MIKRINYLLVADNEVTAQVIEYVRQFPFTSTPFTCSDFGEAVKLVNQETFDVILLDASLEGFNNFTLPVNLQFPSELIIICQDGNCALKAYELGAVDYIIKPFSRPRFSKAFCKALKINVTNQSVSLPEKLMIKSGRRIEIVPFDTILYIEAYGMYSKIIREGGKVIVVNAILAWVEKQLPAQAFMRIHRSYIVNIKKITGFDKRKIYLDEKCFEIGATYKSMFESLFSLLDKDRPSGEE